MNDEEFARSAITRAFPNGAEPGLGLDIDRMVRDGRRESHTRTAGLATGGTVLVGAAALSAWGLVTLSQNGATPGPGAGSSVQKSPGPQPSESQLTASKSAARDRLAKDSSTPCTTTIDLESIVRAALPAGTTVTSASSTTCTIKSPTFRSVDMDLRLAHPKGTLEVQLQSIGAAEALVPSGPASAKAAAKESMAAADGVPLPVCSTVSGGWRACVSHPTKGGIHASAVAFSSPAGADGASGRTVNVVAIG
ncbi:MAG: hypothetical protein QOE76_997, partial [Frankiales bacterium]|nr:hypothetical protein [Frankiales bacterium]